MEDEFYCFCEGFDCAECEDLDAVDHCAECEEMNAHDCYEAGCYDENPNAHIEVFGTYAPGSAFDEYYS